ncbi:MAG: hypothetical protein Q8N23_07005 [Archangium sp.]|nr:hypothetical protein [Archangium sp.]MDP3152401.1 hypothetical protein [Archangium sp.]MDP3574046.1 hypothetical protein [Archangium sp.]
MTGCSPALGRVLVTVVFENETRTQCIRASAGNASGGSINANPASLSRGGKDTLRIGLGETAELVGEVRVTIARFSTPDCSGTAFDTASKTAEVVRGASLATLEFRFVGQGNTDGGTDGGSDGGFDAGCDTAACGNPPGECELPQATGCQGDGGCRFTFKAAQTACGDAGVCNTMGVCVADVCSVSPNGSACNDGLPCTPTSSCQNAQCVGACAAPPSCNAPVTPLTCDLATPTSCAIRPTNEGGSCGAVGNLCLDGGCLPWLQLTPLNFPTRLADVAYPTASWVLASPDGGACDTVISTSGAAATVMQGDCGSPSITSVVNDAGVSVITTLGLDVAPGARLHFVGARPVQLVVVGDASIRGVVTVAPLIAGVQPAGSPAASCVAALPGTANQQGGGGGGFGSTGGRGGDSGGQGGGNTATLTPLRAGCAGAAGFRPAGMSLPGQGGGALQLIVADTLTMPGGVVTASGGGGSAGTGDNEGGGGGGSGGTVIIEARNIDLTGGAVTANGGGGGQGGDTGETSANGALGPIASVTAAGAANAASSSGGSGGIGGDNGTQNGGAGSGGGSRGGGGGGGAAGVIFIRGTVSCTRGGGVISGAQPMPFTCN